MKHRHGNILAVLHYFTIIIERNALDNLELIEHLEKYTKKREATSLLTLPLLGGDYLRLPVSLAGAVVTLRALCQEGLEKRAPDYGQRRHAAAIMPAFKRFGGLVWGYIQKNESGPNCFESLS